MAVPGINWIYLEQNVRPLSKILLFNYELEVKREAEMTNIFGALYDIFVFNQSDRCLADLRHWFSTRLKKSLTFY